MTPTSKVAVVILNWNGRKYLEKFLPPLIRHTKDVELIVADNGSSDDSISFLTNNYPQIRLIRFEQNYGFAKGYNEALKQVNSEYYMILNSDVEVTSGWITNLTDLLDSNPSIVACQPKILAYNNRQYFEYAGAAGGWIDKYGYPFARGRVFDIVEEDKGQYDTTAEVFWASGAALLIRSKWYHDLGGFDEYFFAHQEEIDLCWRIQLAGGKVFCCPASVVYHVGGGTLPRGNSLKTYLNFRNNKIMLSKNLPFTKKLWIMPVRNLLDAVSAWKGLLHGDGGYFIAIVKAQLGFLKWWLFRKNKSVFPTNRNGELSGMLKENIAWLHFVKKKKYFSDITRKQP